jgi:hypothetical protein
MAFYDEPPDACFDAPDPRSLFRSLHGCTPERALEIHGGRSRDPARAAEELLAILADEACNDGPYTPEIVADAKTWTRSLLDKAAGS